MAAEFTITSISWERLNLSFTVESNGREPVSFGFENIKTFKKIPLKHDTEKPGLFHILVNLSTAEPRTFMENGDWILAACTEDSKEECEVSEETALTFDDLSRVFRYGKDASYAYTVSFGVKNGRADVLRFVMRSEFMRENRRWKNRRYMDKHYTPLRNIRGFFKIFYQGLTGLCYKTFRLFSRKTGRNILMMSDTRSSASGNLKAIDERMKQRGLDKEYNIRYYFAKNISNVFVRIFHRFGQIRLIAKQDFIFVDDVAPSLLNFRIDPKVVLVQVWHAGGGFKSVGYCRFGKDGSPSPHDSFHRQYTYALAPSESLVGIFQETFGIEREAVLPTGLPRMDGFLNEKNTESFINEFYEEYPQLRGKKIILFAPTFRGHGISDATYNFEMTDLDRIYSFCGDEYVFAVRMHPFVTETFDVSEDMKDRIYDFSHFPDINQIFFVTDILITDYSSCYYEYSLMGRPMLFYTYDRRHYEITRGVYQDVKSSAPGKVCDTFDELMEALENKDYEFEKVAEYVKINFNEHSRNASDEVINSIILKNS